MSPHGVVFSPVPITADFIASQPRGGMAFPVKRVSPQKMDGSSTCGPPLSQLGTSPSSNQQMLPVGLYSLQSSMPAGISPSLYGSAPRLTIPSYSQNGSTTGMKAGRSAENVLPGNSVLMFVLYALILLLHHSFQSYSYLYYRHLRLGKRLSRAFLAFQPINDHCENFAPLIDVLSRCSK